MYFDIGTASSLLALLVSPRRGGPSNPNNLSNNLHQDVFRPSAFLPRNEKSSNRISTTTATTTTTTTASTLPRHRSPTSLNSAAVVGNNNNNDDNRNLMKPRLVEQEKYVRLLEWLRANGAEVSGCLEIKQSTQGEQAGYGAFVRERVREGELLFSIPRDLCVTIEKAKSSADDDGTFGEGLGNIIEKAGPGGSTVAMAGYMAKEYILMYLNEREKELSNSNDDGNDRASRWGPYMELLPWKRGINNQEHILFWSEAKVEQLLRGSVSYLEAKSLREEVALSITVLGPLLKRSVRMARGDLSTSAFERFKNLLPWEQYNRDASRDDLSEILDDKLIGDAIKGAFVTLLTRSFADDDVPEDGSGDGGGGDDDYDDDGDGDDGDDDAAAAGGYSEKLVPLLDLLQHSDKPNVRHRVVGNMGTSDARVEVRARCDIEQGSELWNQYRSEEDEAMPYSRFFTRFGFVPGIDEPIENLLLDKSTIFYPQKAEV